MRDIKENIGLEHGDIDMKTTEFPICIDFSLVVSGSEKNPRTSTHSSTDGVQHG